MLFISWVKKKNSCSSHQLIINMHLQRTVMLRLFIPNVQHRSDIWSRQPVVYLPDPDYYQNSHGILNLLDIYYDFIKNLKRLSQHSKSVLSCDNTEAIKSQSSEYIAFSIEFELRWKHADRHGPRWCNMAGYCSTCGSQVALWKLIHWLSCFDVASQEIIGSIFYLKTTEQWPHPIDHRHGIFIWVWN